MNFQISKALKINSQAISHLFTQKNDLSFKNTSSKGKMPWISYNDEDLADSDFCMDFLMKEFNVNLSSWLSPLEQSIARAYSKLTEESFRW